MEYSALTPVMVEALHRNAEHNAKTYKNRSQKALDNGDADKAKRASIGAEIWEEVAETFRETSEYDYEYQAVLMQSRKSFEAVISDIANNPNKSYKMMTEQIFTLTKFFVEFDVGYQPRHKIKQ